MHSPSTPNEVQYFSTRFFIECFINWKFNYGEWWNAVIHSKITKYIKKQQQQQQKTRKKTKWN
jgi:hypothetical protein